jgi:hypothetical protein
VKVLFTFETVSAALDGELAMKEQGIPCRIIPVPRALSSSCAYAMTAETGDLPGLCGTLRRRGSGYLKVFRCRTLPDESETYTLLAGPDNREAFGQKLEKE